MRVRKCFVSLADFSMNVLLLQSYPDSWLVARFFLHKDGSPCPASYGLVSLVLTGPSVRRKRHESVINSAMNIIMGRMNCTILIASSIAADCCSDPSNTDTARRVSNVEIVAHLETKEVEQLTELFSAPFVHTR